MTLNVKLTKAWCLGAALVLLAGTLAAVPLMAKEKPKAQQQADVRAMAKETLNQLFKVQPKAKPAIQKAAGYAVFSNFGMKILVAGSGSGKGIAVDASSKKETFMRMFEVQAGLGFGVKKFKVVFVFETKKALDAFIQGEWTMGGQANASAQDGNKGGSMSGAYAVGEGVWVYQMTDKGLAVELTAKGTKYSVDKDLN